MKKLPYAFILMCFLAISAMGQNNVGINDNNSSPNASAMLDIYSVSKGMLIPRVALDTTTSATPVTSPATSLLVYNTATVKDVTPGYYYWNGSKWVRLVATTDPEKNYNLVTKTSNVTLLKTENMVVASGDITLTLPTVTSADDGLEIAIKNTGTWTDLVTIVAQSGKKIDSVTSSTLTRWKGRTFIASGSNWIIKEKEARTDNLLDVSTTGSFRSIAEVVDFLDLHMAGPTVVRIGGGSYPIEATQTIDFDYPVTFEGISYGETEIIADAGLSGSPMFDCASECYFKMLMFTAVSNAAGNDGIRCTGAGEYFELKDSYLVGFNKGVVSTVNNDLWIFETDFEDCTGAGIEIAAGAASGGSLKISETDFISCGKGINLLSGVAETVSIMNCTFYNTVSGTDIGILYTPSTFTTFSSIFITNNAWNNQGTFISGFDFSLATGRDANAFITNNSGSENENPHCKINVNNNSTSTTVTNAGTYYKANWTNSSTSYTCKWTLANNKITYQPNNGGDVWAMITGNLSISSTTNSRYITVAIVKNGVTSTRYGETDLRPTAANLPFQFSTVIYIPNVNKNDYLEVYVTSSYSSTVVIFRDVQWFTNSQ